jgi:hypothetical protein
MITSPIRMTLAVLALALTPVMIQAQSVPEGKAALVEAVLGRVQLKVDGKSSTPKVGQALDFGATLVTGSNGRVSLRHAGNSVSRLAPNTELTLRAPEAKQKGTFLALGKGIIRFLVGKRAPGESFEVSTSNAVAAVKGTDGEVETDGTTTKAAVYSSGLQKAMDLLSSASGKSMTLAPGQAVDLAEGGFQTRELSAEDFERSQQQFSGLPEPSLDGADAGPAEDARSESQAAGALADAISDAFSSVMADLEVDNLLERNDRNDDLVAGRIAYDRNGDRTQISSYVVRAADNTIMKATYSQRESGPFAGTTFAEEQTVWNRALPDDWASIARDYLDSPANSDANGEPIHWRASQYFRAGNPQGDLMQVWREYERPYFEAWWDGERYYRGELLPQGFEQELHINGSPVQYLAWLADSEYYSDPQSEGYSPNNDSFIADGPYAYESSWDENTDYDGQKVSFNYCIYCETEQDVFLTTELRVLTQDGTVLDPLSVLHPDVRYGFQYGEGETGLRFFRGLDNAYSIELTFLSPLLSAPIDLLVIPEIFNHFDFFDMPGWDYYGPPSGGGEEEPCGECCQQCEV